MGYTRLRRRQLWSAGASEASEARPRFGSLDARFRHSQSAVAAALCQRFAGPLQRSRLSTLLLQKIACETRFEPCYTRALPMIRVDRELSLEVVACRLLEIAWTVFCPIWDKRLSMQFYATLG